MMTVAVALVSSVGSAARAQTDEPFGRPGQIVASVPRLIPLVALDSSTVHTSAPNDGPSGTSLTFGGNHPSGIDLYGQPRAGLDWIATPHLTLGLDVTGTLTLGRGPVLGDSPYVTALGVSPRIGYIVALPRPMSVWLRAGTAYYALGERGIDGTPAATQTWSLTWKQLDADVEVFFVAAPLPHVAVTCGIFAEVPLAGWFDERRSGGGASVDAGAAWLHVGLTGGLLVYL